MKKLLFIALLLSPWMLVSSQDNDSVKVILLKPAEFSEEMKIVSHPELIDVREYFEFKKTRLPGAVNIPSSGNIDIAADSIDKASHLFLYCTSGFRSKRVAQRFADKGFLHVYSLDGGITAWKQEGFPVEKRKTGKKK